MEIKKATTQYDFFSIMKIRAQVFMCEQEVDPLLEIDDEDKTCTHYLIEENDKCIGCARVIESDDIWHLGRIAILKEYRNKHFGSLLLEKLERWAIEKNVKKLQLGAQTQAIPFYEKNGYVVYGKHFEEANMSHFHMEKVL